jgi:hypothetical protein
MADEKEEPKGLKKARERAAKANEAADEAQKRGEQAGHGIKLTRREIKAAKKK